MAVAVVWFRRDLRLADNPALRAATDAGMSVLALYVHAPDEEGDGAAGAASRTWLHRSLQSLDADLRRLGSALVLRRGPSLATLREVVAESGASAVFFNRSTEPLQLARDRVVLDALREDGLRAESFNASLLAEPWTVQNKSGAPYRVFTPFWRALSSSLRDLSPLTAPPSLDAAPAAQSLSLDALRLCPRVRWDRGFWEEWTPGERGARERLAHFLERPVDTYASDRDRPDYDATSRLSPHLHFGEISPRQVLHAVRSAGKEGGNGEAFVRQIGWREFAHHLLHHFPETAQRNMDPRFDRFRWADPDERLLAAWQQGLTGVPLVDAGMRQLWQEGWMHNRVRMVVASFLTKNLRMHWLHGAAWFRDTLLDADLANNTMGWQWVAGTGADAAPYFRIFNPLTQSRRFDPQGRYLRRWLPELAAVDGNGVHAPWESPAAAAQLGGGYPQRPVVDLATSREAALRAYRATR